MPKKINKERDRIILELLKDPKQSYRKIGKTLEIHWTTVGKVKKRYGVDLSTDKVLTKE